ncbi:hypothetical protein [Pedobacter xixiisoli]|uniref:Uncharacterized protein n=1 Tax=Pedobacter xixiisoli TaxID=1476464 RepID=A0A286A6M6_9SPHI|nr:hypothetical protein [Pedobacter xixiisoli]SOD17555.1 hypothetical protein SAMN06297358_2575 [Pedobacter xixiisoli]
MKNIIALFFSIIFISACKKDEPAEKADLYPAQPLVTASSSAIAVFHQPIAYYQMYVYRYEPSTGLWTNRIAGHFSTISAADPSFIGFGNPNVLDSGAPMFDMVRLYSAYTGTTNIKTVGINVDQVLQFFPDYEGAKTGIVKVKTQDVVLRKSTAGQTITIGMSGGGTYDETSKVMDLKITFNEAAIGGTTRTFDYKLSPTALTL